MKTKERSDPETPSFPMKEVVIFGAGASHGARNPRPPLGDSLHRYILKYLEAKRQIDSPFPGCVGRDIKKVKEKLSVAPSYEEAVKKLFQELSKEQKYVNEFMNRGA